MMAKIPWMTKFISGPKDPQNNPYSVYCHVCQISISTRGKGHHDIIRHWQRDKHFRKEQLYRDTHGMAVLDRKRNVLTGHRLEREREIFSHASEFEIGTRYPFYGMETSSPSDHVDPAATQLKMQLECLYDLISKGQQIPTLRSVWKVVMSHLPSSELMSGMDFSEERTVCLVQFLFNCQMKVLREVIGSGEQYGLVFEDALGDRRVHLSFWRNDSLVTLALFSCDRLTESENLDFLILSRLFAALNRSCCPVSCVGVKLNLIKTLDRYFQPATGILAHAPISSRTFEKLLTNPSNLVFGRVDVISVIEHIMMRLRGAHNEAWFLQSPTLLQVGSLSFVSFCPFFNVFSSFEPLFINTVVLRSVLYFSISTGT